MNYPTWVMLPDGVLTQFVYQSSLVHLGHLSHIPFIRFWQEAVSKGGPSNICNKDRVF